MSIVSHTAKADPRPNINEPKDAATKESSMNDQQRAGLQQTDLQQKGQPMKAQSNERASGNDLSDKHNSMKEASMDIAHEFKNFVSDVENLIKETASLTGDDLARAQLKFNQRISAAKAQITKASSTIATQATDQARKAAVRTNEYVHEQPWAVIGTSTLVSFVLGLLLGNGHREERSTK